MINKNSKLMIIFIAIFCALPPFAIDTYSPAIPSIAAYFNILPTLVISTFTSYLAGFAGGIILWGPLSDVYGRRKILIIGACLYLISSIICPLSSNYEELVWARFGQGFGDAACATVAMAIARDCFSGQNLVKVLATIGTIFMVAPIVAPIIGALIIHKTNHWQSIFHFLTGYGIVLLLLSFLIPETITDNLRVRNIKSAFYHYLDHCTNRSFLLPVYGATLVRCSMFSFIGTSAIIYIKIYHTSEIIYAILFGLNGVSIIFANLLLKKISNTIKLRQLQIIGTLGAIASLIIGYSLISTFPHTLYIFVIVALFTAFFSSISSNTLNADALNQIQHSFGTATSINQFSQFLFAGIANYIISKCDPQGLNITLITEQIILMLCVFCLINFMKATHR
jgi:Bcr/CflA subfamily drug resistance transporter